MKRKIRIALGFAIGGFLIWLLFRNTDWRAVYDETRQMKLRWVLVSQVFVMASFITRIWRWGYIVRVAKPVSFRSRFSATQIGFLGNMVLPLRAGEFIRAFVLARLAKLPFAKCMAMVVLDRVTDLVGLLAVVLVAALTVPKRGVVIPEGLFDNADPIPVSSTLIQTCAISTVVLILAVLGALVLLYLNQKLALRIADRVVGAVARKHAERVHALLQQFADGLHIFRSGSDMAKSIFFSLLTWGCFLGGLVSFLYAFDIPFPWYAPFVIQALVAVAVSVPGMPGFAGQFHAGVFGGLLMVVPATPIAQAQALAIVTHLFNCFLPLVIVGVACLIWEDLGLFELRRQASQMQKPSN